MSFGAGMGVAGAALATALSQCLSFAVLILKVSEQKQIALESGVQALLRDRLIYQYEKYKSRGYAPIYAKENFENLYEQYHKLGANGVMDSIHEEFKNLPASGGENT